MNLFLDLDGVIRDWVSSANLLVGLPKDYEYKSYYEIEDIIKNRGDNVVEFWESQEEDFWGRLSFLPGAKELLYYVERIVHKPRICLLTSPTLTSAGHNQKWIRSNMSWYFHNKQYLIGPAKQFCAGFGSILIDDSDRNCEIFSKSGGHSILYPQSYNKNRDKRNNSVDYTITKLKEIIDQYG